jgi:mono/diheme cytochrome c family protein
MMRLHLTTIFSILGILSPIAHADEPPSKERGEKALLGRHFTPGTIPVGAYKSVWKVWDPKAVDKPADFDEQLRERYGLHPAPYPNGGYPMGLREAPGLIKAVAADCMLCHGGSILGKSYVGLGNSTLDLQTFSEEMAQSTGLKFKGAYSLANVRGTTEAGAIAVFLLSMRAPDLTLRDERLELELHDDLCEDTPAWWLLKKKKTMYYTGGADAHSVRSIMQFMMSPLNSGPSITKEEKTFRDIQAYLLSLEAPKYPFPINKPLAEKGQKLFEQTCARCHGTYGEQWTYPNRIVPLKEIGTDPKRYQGLSPKVGEYYNKTWFAQEKGEDGYKAIASEGYQAPPLDGIWATAPYFHNGSAPTVYHVLNSKARPKIFARSYRTDEAAYDKEKLGWKFEVKEKGPAEDAPGSERRKIYDTTLPGRSNSGHTFGDKLSDDERMAIIEYLKTL